MVRKIRNKRGMSLAIAFLVFATLILTVFSLIAFNLRAQGLKRKISIVSLDDVYFAEEIINYVVDDLMENALKDFRVGDSKEKFIHNFREGLKDYKSGDTYLFEELQQVEEQLTENNVEIDNENNKVSLNLAIDISYRIRDRDKEIVYVKYSYPKTFTREF